MVFLSPSSLLFGIWEEKLLYSFTNSLPVCPSVTLEFSSFLFVSPDFSFKRKINTRDYLDRLIEISASTTNVSSLRASPAPRSTCNRTYLFSTHASLLWQADTSTHTRCQSISPLSLYIYVYIYLFLPSLPSSPPLPIESESPALAIRMTYRINRVTERHT